MKINQPWPVAKSSFEVTNVHSDTIGKLHMWPTRAQIWARQIDWLNLSSIAQRFVRYFQFVHALSSLLLSLSPGANEERRHYMHTLHVKTHTHRYTVWQPRCLWSKSMPGRILLTAVCVVGNGDDSHGLVGDVCSQYLGVSSCVLVRTQNRPSSPVRPEDKVSVDSQAKEGSRAGLYNDLQSWGVHDQQ